MLGLACDGTGYAPGGQIWGFELMKFNFEKFERMGTMLPFRLPGSEAAILDPRRSALSLLHEALGDDVDSIDLGLTPEERAFILQMVRSNVNSPYASSCGRLFDAVSAMFGICRAMTYEGQPAMELEASADLQVEGCYPYDIRCSGMIVFDHRPMVRAMADDLRSHEGKGRMAAKFHNTLVRAMTEMIATAAEKTGMKEVILGGGCFSNSLLVNGIAQEASRQGIKAIMPKLIPPNDGGISYGQVVVASTR
jgi:hydrogenase maturation protein HypF